MAGVKVQIEPLFLFSRFYAILGGISYSDRTRPSPLKLQEMAYKTLRAKEPLIVFIAAKGP